jgi:hypothetical protein
MSADAARWPRLKLPTHPVLDWIETVYAKAQLLTMADAVGSNAHAIRAASGEVWDTAVETVLRALATSPTALKALNHRRPTLPARVLGVNRATHFHVLTELHPGKKSANKRDVAKVWRVTDKHVEADVREYQMRGTTYRPDDAKRLMLTIVNNTCKASGRARAAVLKDFDADMRHRAVASRKKK